VGQGLSLSPLIHVLGVQPDDEAEHELRQARRALTEAALLRLEDLALTDDIPEAVIADQRAHLEKLLSRLNLSADGDDRRDGDDSGDGWSPLRHLRREMLSAQRAMLITLRKEGKISDEVVRRLERDLDLEEQHEQQHVG
jgi:CPA1 family monovalent cation:H+ antiporter